jgi:pimeloyl-ACP methyl ester carboxylesterase
MAPSLAAYVSAPVTANPKIRLVIVVVHGAGRDAKPAFNSAMNMVALAKFPKDEVLVISPQFLNQYDLRKNSDGTDALYWFGIDWIFSEKALNSDITTYGAIDRLVARLSDKRLFPKLQRIMIVGHSAGGQFVQRYAMVGKAAEELKPTKIELRYIVANPSSFVYPLSNRPSPPAAGACPLFNDWRYGLKSMPSHISARSETELVQAYLKLNITYLNGASDNDPNNPSLDRGCEAETQGVSRLDRGQKFFTALTNNFGVPKEQKICLVQGVAHEEEKMLASECALVSTFGELWKH